MLACLPFDIIAETSVKFLANGFLKIELKAHSHGYAGFFIALFVYLFHFRYSGGLCLYLVPQNNNHLDNNNNNSHLAETSPYWIV